MPRVPPVRNTPDEWLMASVLFVQDVARLPDAISERDVDAYPELCVGTVQYLTRPKSS